MDVYDFDGTLYCGDSTADFLRFCLRRHPRVARTLPRTCTAALAWLKLHKIEDTDFKQVLYRFLRLLPDIDREVYLFWASHECKIGGPCTPQPGDLVISASPEFLLSGPCTRRGLQLMASKVDPHTGTVLSPNCSKQQKVVRFRERFPEAQIKHFYSDSRDDDPLAAIAEQAFMVNTRRGTVEAWPS